MSSKMSLQLRRELLEVIRPQYAGANWTDKNKLIDGFVAATGYDRKYTIVLLNKPADQEKPKRKQRAPTKYDEQVHRALLTVWYASNQICSKRMVPFLPVLVDSLERHGHLSLPGEVRKKLLEISPATVDRLLRLERAESGKAISTTRPGSLLKHKIKVRTFADWDDVEPGFVEADTVSHCGGVASGSFLRTLTLTDISTGWVEILPLLRGCGEDVIAGLNVVRELLPFPLLGLDTDNGSEFINIGLIGFCKDNRITFTRSRAYRKNDQAHVEQKNSSVVRRIVGYDRYEGKHAWAAMSKLYRYLRLYVNFFQPSMKLSEKTRTGAKVSKTYDTAKTPLQRVLQSDCIEQSVKDALQQQFLRLDPIALLKQLENAQNRFFKFAWHNSSVEKPVQESSSGEALSSRLDFLDEVVKHSVQPSNGSDVVDIPNLRIYRHEGKPRAPRTWRSRKDPFEHVWGEVKIQLELTPDKTSKEIMAELLVKYPDEFKKGQLRTLQRKVKEWRTQQTSYQEQMLQAMLPEKTVALPDQGATI